jgi:hypothetical protein
VTGIGFLDYAAARVQAVAGNVITLNINSSAYAGTFSSGTLIKLDRSTIYGGWEFLIYYAKNCAAVFGTGAASLRIVLCTAPSEYTGGNYSKEIFSIGTYIKKIAAKWGAAVFDGTFEYGVTLQDQPIYFDDLIHPLTLPQRQAYANHIVRFCQGGAVRVPDPDQFLPSGSQTYTDGGIATYSEFAQGFGTFTRFFGDPVEKLRQDFTSGLTGWTVTGPAPTIAASPWSPSDQAALFTASVATPSAYISHSLILGKGREIHCTFSLPSISNLCDVAAPVPASVTLISLRSSGSYYLFNFAIRNPATVQTRAQYFETPNVTLDTLAPTPGTMIAAATRYDVIIKCYQGLSVDEPGRFLIYINGALVGGPYELNDFGQTAIAELRVGAIGSNTGKNFQVHVGNIIAYDLAESDTPNYGITYLAPGGTLSIPLDDKLDEVVSVTGWMTTPYNSAADHTTWLQNVIEKVHTNFNGAAVGIAMPHPIYNLSATLSIPYNHITLIGRGRGGMMNTAPDTRASAATRIAFKAGSTPAPLLEWAPASGSAYGITGGGLRNIMLDGFNLATRALSVLSAQDMLFEAVHCFAATQAQIFCGAIAGTLTSNIYDCKGHFWRQIRAHAHNIAGNTAYALQLTGHQGAGGANAGNSCFQTFQACIFTALNNHGVYLQDSDSNLFIAGNFGFETAGNYGLRCTSADNGGPPRQTRFIGVQILDTYLEASQTGGLSPFGLEFISNSRANAGGVITAQVPAGGALRPAYIVEDRFGKTAFGDDDFTITGFGIGPPANQSVSPAMLHTGNLPPTSATFGTDRTPVITEGYVCAINVPCTMTLAGAAILNGSAIAGTIKMYLFDSVGNIARVGNGTATSGIGAYQRVAWTSPYVAKGPATYYLVLTSNNVAYRFRAHNFGNFPTRVLTGLTFGTTPPSFTPPTTFVVDAGPIASLY